MDIVFFGNERLATGVGTTAPVLQALIDNGYSIKALIIAQNEFGKSRKTRGVEIADLADMRNIPVFAPVDLSKEVDDIKALGGDIGVLVAYGKIVPQSIIDIFPHGIVNIHPSLLPKHRGPTPIESTILNGEHRGGVSIMKLSAEMDAGPVYAQQSTPLIGTETKRDLVGKLHTMGKNLLLATLPLIISGEIKPTPQDDRLATYDRRFTKVDGSIDWSKSAQQIEREIRAFIDWPKSRTTLGSKDVIITKASVSDKTGTPGAVLVEDKNLFVFCGENALLVEQLKPAGKQEMTSQAFLAGYKV